MQSTITAIRKQADNPVLRTIYYEHGSLATIEKMDESEDLIQQAEWILACLNLAPNVSLVIIAVQGFPPLEIALSEVSPHALGIRRIAFAH